MCLIFSLSFSTLSSTSLYVWPLSSRSFLLRWLGTRGGRKGGGGSLSIFSPLQNHVQQETANWSVKQGCSLQVATGWAHLPLNSLWQVRSQPHGGARHPTERREACGCSSWASQDLPLHCTLVANSETSHGLSGVVLNGNDKVWPPLWARQAKSYKPDR